MPLRDKNVQGSKDKEKRTEVNMADLLADQRVEKGKVGETALLQQNIQAPDQRYQR